MNFADYLDKINAMGSDMLTGIPTAERWTCKQCKDTIPPLGSAGGTGTHVLCIAQVLIAIADTVGKDHPGKCVACLNPVIQTETEMGNHVQCLDVLENNARDLWSSHFVEPPVPAASQGPPEAMEAVIEAVTGLAVS